MKKIIFLVILMVCLISLGATALVQYKGSPQLPYLIYGTVNWNSQLLSGARLEITNQNTGFVKAITTDSNGYWQEDAQNWQTNNEQRPPVMYGDIIKITVTDGCGTGDTCSNSFSAMSGTPGAYKDWAVIDFSITGTLACPPVSCPSCGGGGGGGGCACSYTESMCRDLYPCAITVCPTTSFSESKCRELYPCQDITCPTCPVTEYPTCEVCKECPDETSPLGAVIIAILTFLIGGGAVYISLGRANKVKVVKKDGKDVVTHQHPVISGYHSPNTIHSKEPHKKGELVPKYEKDTAGVWRYVG